MFIKIRNCLLNSLIPSSEAVVVWCNKGFDFVEVSEIFEYTIFKDCVEFMLDACENRSLLIFINAAIVEFNIPVQCVQVDNFECVQYFANSSLNLRVVEIWINFSHVTWNFHSHWVKLDGAALESKQVCYDIINQKPTAWGTAWEASLPFWSLSWEGSIQYGSTF